MAVVAPRGRAPRGCPATRDRPPEDSDRPGGRIGRLCRFDRQGKKYIFPHYFDCVICVFVKDGGVVTGGGVVVTLREDIKC